MQALTLEAPLTRGDNIDLKERFKKRFAKRLADVRIREGLTQEELGVKAAIHLSYVGQLELGSYVPTSYVVWKLAQALNVSSAELLDI